MWELATETLVFESADENQRITAMEFARDGRWLATADLEGRVRLWDGLTCDLVRDWKGHEGGAHAISFCPDGKTLASGGRRGSILLWTVPPYRQAGVARAREDEGSGKGESSSPRKLAALWKRLAGREAADGFAALAEMARKPAATISYLRRKLPVPVAIGEEKLQSLIRGLDAAEFTARVQAEEELLRVATLLRDRLEEIEAQASSPEVKFRLQRILENSTPPYRTESSEAVRMIRAVLLLEVMDHPEAGTLLQRLAGGAQDALLTHEARAAFARWSRRQ